jgi:hypothetical protein
MEIEIDLVKPVHALEFEMSMSRGTYMFYGPSTTHLKVW